jgi:hypothetical protein
MLLEMLGSIIKFNHHNLPKIIGQHEKFQNCLILFSSIRMFREWPKRLGRKWKLKKTYNICWKVPKLPKCFHHQDFPKCKILGRIELFSTFVICPKLSGNIKWVSLLLIFTWRSWTELDCENYFCMGNGHWESSKQKRLQLTVHIFLFNTLSSPRITMGCSGLR